MALTKKNKRLLWVGIIIFLFIILGVVSSFIVKYLWMDGLGYENIFWTIKVTEIVLFLISLIFVLLYIAVNIRFLSKEIRPIHLDLGQGPQGTPNMAHVSVKQIKTILYTFAIIISLFFAFSFSAQWNEYLRFLHAQPFGTADPLFGNDVSFYVFTLPFIETVQNSLALLFFFVTAVMTVFHLATRSISLPNNGFGPNLGISPRARKHIFTNLSIWLLLLGVGYFLDRYHLVNKNNDIIYGANYTDVHVLIPVYWVMVVGCVLLAIYTFSQRYRFDIKKLGFGALALIIVGIVGQLFLPGIIQNFKVDPSEFTMEKPFIENNIHFTRRAYKLDSVDVREYNATDSVTLQQVLEHKESIKNVRIWDQDLTVQTYKQLQEIRLYYQFYNIDLDRYHTDKGYRQVLISARELTSSLPEKAQTWVNKKLQYTHGFGIVMSPTTQKTEEGSPYFNIKDIPPHSNIGLQVTQPAVYYGEMNSGYKLVNTEISELDYPKGNENVYTHYNGKGGVPIDNFLEQALFSWHFSDINLLLTDYIKDGSKIQFWRSVRTRVHKIAPFLELDDDPYIVLDHGKLYWILDAYTTASQYPYADPYSGNQNYIRNSVKVVVDAYQGTVDFYTANASDPVLQTYKGVFPGVFKPLDEMPGDLKQHVKYPKTLFEIQLQKFSTFHMREPRTFYNQEDLWERPDESYGGREVRMRPYYLLGMLPDSKRLQYMLISPMTPNNRDNMVSWMVVKSDFPGYGEIINYELPKERLFLGPAQIEAKINQNTEISRQLSLWDQRGSKVIRGNMMVIPIDKSFLYVEPVFLFSTSVNIPQLKRVIATTGSNVVMEPTLNEAIYALYGKTEIPGIPDIGALSDSTNVVLPPTIIQQVANPKLDKMKGLWGEMQDALQNRNWQKFGKKMDAINDLLKNSD